MRKRDGNEKLFTLMTVTVGHSSSFLLSPTASYHFCAPSTSFNIHLFHSFHWPSLRAEHLARRPHIAIPMFSNHTY